MYTERIAGMFLDNHITDIYVYVTCSFIELHSLKLYLLRVLDVVLE